MGGIDWSGLPYVAAFLGITDLHLFMAQLLAMKTHQPPKDDAGDEPATLAQG